jgi:hypothetical protein
VTSGDRARRTCDGETPGGVLVGAQYRPVNRRRLNRRDDLMGQKTGDDVGDVKIRYATRFLGPVTPARLQLQRLRLRLRPD